MINLDIIKTKLNIIRDNLLNIKTILVESDETLNKDNIKKSALERFFQLVVDAAIGINEHIISEENLEIPNDYFGTFLILGKAGIIPMNFAQKIAPSVGLRNQLIHQYEKIDTDTMLISIRNNINQYEDYMGFIIKHCQLS